MKRLIFLTLPLVFALTSCQNGSLLPPSREIEDMELVRAIGVDLEDGEVKITALTAGGTENKSATFNGSGATVAEAIGLLSRLPAGKNAIFSHTESLIIGEEAAKDGISGILDYIGRSNELRLGVRLFIVKGGTASGLIEGCKEDAGEILGLLGENAAYLGGFAFTAGDSAAALERAGACLIQSIALNDSLEPVGFAAIEDGRLKLYLDNGASEGAAIIMNKLQGGEVALGSVTLMLNGAATRFEPVFSAGRLTGLRLRSELTARVAGAPEVDLTDEAVRRELETGLAKYEAERIAAALSASQKEGADFFDLKGSAMEAAPLRSRAIAAENCSELEIEYAVSARLTGSFDLEDGRMG